MINNFENFLGKNSFVWFMGVCEDNVDPLTLGRIKVRCFGFHPTSREDVPTIDLPWAMVIQPSTSASTSGIGFSPNGIKPDSWVLGFFADGETAQFPIVLGTIPRIHSPSGPDSYIGNSGAGYHTDDSIYSGAPTPGDPNAVNGPYNFVPPINPSGGSTIKDDGSYLTKQNISSWPLKVYQPTPSRGDYGLACKDGDSSLRIHYASVLALEELGRRFGKNPQLNSAYRSPTYNRGVGGATKSQHIQGRAFDIPYSSIGGSSRGNLARFAQTAVQCGFVGFGLYNSFIHIDTGSGRVWGGARADWFVSALRAAGWREGKPGLSDVRVSNTQTGNNNLDSTTTGSTTPADPNSPNGVKDYLAQRMKEQGYNDYAIAAAQAHAFHESGLNPTKINPNDRGLPAYGLFQWRDSRYRDLQATGDTSLKGQVDHFLNELNTSERSAGARLRGASSLADANDGMRMFERYADPGGAETNRRYGTASGYYGGDSASDQAFAANGFQDPTGSLPYGGYMGKPSTHNTARGVNANMYQPELQRNNDARLTTFPNAGDKGTIGEPAFSEAPQYPYNFTYASMSGHMWEYDDTPGVERINVQHKTGSRLVMGSGGSSMLKSYGNMYNISGGDNYILTMGGMKISSKDDIDMRTTSDMTIHSDGSLTLLVRNDNVEHVSGKKDVLVAETLQIKANRIIIEAENIDFVAHANMTFEAGGNMSMRAGGTMATSAADTKMHSSGSFDADAGSLKWLEGAAKEIPEHTGKSTDLGAPPARSKVQKRPYIQKNPDNTPDLGEAMAFYSRSDPTKRTT